MYSVGKARRFVAGNIWCAQKCNSGRFPCLLCRGSGVIERRGCPDCEATGYSDPRLFKLWMKLWIYMQVTGKEIDSALFYR